MTRLADIDAVTIDGYETLLELRDPVGALGRLVPDRSRDDVARAFAAEVAYYSQHSYKGGDAASLERLHAECARVFSEAIGVDVPAAEFNASFEFQEMPGARAAVERLRSCGLSLAVVANWDFGIHEHLRKVDLYDCFTTVVSSAELGTKKPDPRPFLVALERLGVEPSRALHVGDDAADERGAAAAGMHFEWAPLASAIERLT